MTPVERVRGDTSIREATRADLLDVLRIEKSVFPQPWPYSAFEQHVDAPGFLVSESSTDGDAPGGEGVADVLDDETDETLDEGEAIVFDGEVLGGEDASDEQADTLAGVTGLDNSITGYVVADNVHNHGRPLGHVKNLAVHPDCRNEGVGSALLAQSLSVLAAQGAHGVKLEVRRSNDAAIALYRSFDFEYMRTLQEYYADGEDALLFVANLEDRDGF